MTSTELDRDLDLLLTETAAVAPPAPDCLEAGRAALVAAGAAEAGRDGRVRRRVLITTAVAVAAAAAVVGPSISLPGHHPSVGADAASVLTTASAAAGERPGGWPHAHYWHVTSDYVRDGHEYHREFWIGNDRPSALIDPGVDPGVIRIASGPFASGVSWAQLYALPTDPAALTRALRRVDRGQGRNPDQQLFSTVAELLGETPAPPELRRALYRVAAAVPGIAADGPLTDRDGRRGEGVSRDGEQIIVDPSTGQLLQDRQGDDFVATYDTQGPAAVAP